MCKKRGRNIKVVEDKMLWRSNICFKTKENPRYATVYIAESTLLRTITFSSLDSGGNDHQVTKETCLHFFPPFPSDKYIATAEAKGFKCTGCCSQNY